MKLNSLYCLLKYPRAGGEERTQCKAARNFYPAILLAIVGDFNCWGFKANKMFTALWMKTRWIVNWFLLTFPSFWEGAVLLFKYISQEVSCYRLHRGGIPFIYCVFMCVNVHTRFKWTRASQQPLSYRCLKFRKNSSKERKRRRRRKGLEWIFALWLFPFLNQVLLIFVGNKC